MKLGSIEEGDAPELAIAPLVDLVFTLLAFFILAAQITAAEWDFDLGHRGPATARLAHEDLPENVPVRLRAAPQGVNISVGEIRLADNDFAALRARLTQIDLPRLEVVIMAEPAVRVDDVAKALDAVLASPMKRVSLARLGRAGGRHEEAVEP